MNLILNYKIVKTDFQFKYRKFFDICSVILFYQLIFNKSGISYGQEKEEQETPTTEEGQLPSYDEEFSEWMNDIIFRVGIEDYRYNLKGCGVWMAYGFKLRKYAMDIMRNLLDNTPIPHEEYLFPLLVPEPQFMKEAEHVKGFENEVYWVTHGGLEELDIKLALRPTSETVMYPMFVFSESVLIKISP